MIKISKEKEDPPDKWQQAICEYIAQNPNSSYTQIKKDLTQKYGYDKQTIFIRIYGNPKNIEYKGLIERGHIIPHGKRRAKGKEYEDLFTFNKEFQNFYPNMRRLIMIELPVLNETLSYSIDEAKEKVKQSEELNEMFAYFDAFESMFSLCYSIEINQDDSRSKEFIMREDLRRMNGWLGYFMILANFAYNPYYWNFNLDDQEEFIKEFPSKISINLSFEIPEAEENNYKSILFTCFKNVRDYLLKRKRIEFPSYPIKQSKYLMDKLIKNLETLPYDDPFVLEAIAEKEYNKYKKAEEGIKLRGKEGMKEKIQHIVDNDYKFPEVYSEEILRIKKELEDKGYK